MNQTAIGEKYPATPQKETVSVIQSGINPDDKGVKNSVIIAIDGPSGTGKSTTAKLVAKELNYTYLDTGAMYRAVAWAAENEKCASKNDACDGGLSKTSKLLEKIKITFDPQTNNIFINGINREKEIRSPEISAVVSKYSALPQVRASLTSIQQKIGENQNSVLDGRDIGTAVFPNAKFKFFLTADYKTRAARRLAELKEKGIAASETLESIEKNLRERDEQDSGRELAPLIKAKDAIEIDTSQLTITQQVQKVLQSVGEAARCSKPLNCNPNPKG